MPRGKAAAILIAVCAATARAGHAEDDFTLRLASWVPGKPEIIAVSFAESLPPDPQATDVRRWKLRLVDLQTGEIDCTLAPIAAFVSGAAQNTIVQLRFERPLDLWTETRPKFHATVSFWGTEFHEVAVRLPGTRRSGGSGGGRYVAARGKSDADIYLNGLYAFARDGDPTYAGEAILRRFWGFREGPRGRFGGEFTLDVAEEPNVDPDAITAGLVYEKMVGLGSGQTALVFAANPFQLEADRAEDRRNLDAALTLTLSTKSIGLGPGRFLALEPFAGLEAGRRVSTADGVEEEADDRSIFRFLTGANLYFLSLQPAFGIKRVTVNVQYLVRALGTDEPFSETTDGVRVESMTRRARHYLAGDVAVLFNDFFGVTGEYRYGSLPPAYNKLDHKVSFGFVFQAKQK